MNVVITFWLGLPLFPQACDTIENIDKEVYEQMAQAAASVLDVSYCNCLLKPLCCSANSLSQMYGHMPIEQTSECTL